MKLFFASLAFVFCTANIFAQSIVLPKYESGDFALYYWQKQTHYLTLPQSSKDIIFLGDSITDGAEWAELFDNPSVKNRGISGDTTKGVLNRLAQITAGHPAKIFLLIGTNDLSKGSTPTEVLKNILQIAAYIKQESPRTQLYIQSILPVNDAFSNFDSHVKNGGKIDEVNQNLSSLADTYAFQYIDLASGFKNINGKMDEKYTNDGLHLLGAGYLRWKELIQKYITP